MDTNIGARAATRNVWKKHRRIGSFSPLRSVCDMLQVCQVCSRIINCSTSTPHSCDTRFWKTCNCQRSYNHLCFMAPLKPQNKASEYTFIFHDFETQQSETVPGDASKNVHVPNLCVAQQVSFRCVHDLDLRNGCSACGLVREFVFHKDPVNATRPV